MSTKETIAQMLQRRLSEVPGRQKEIAEACGLAQATISRLSTGKCQPRVDTAEALLAWFAAEDAKGKRRKRRKTEAAHAVAAATA